MLDVALSWLSTYGFELNNREEAALVWLILTLIGLTVGILLKPDIRSSLVSALRIAFTSKLVIIWVVYVLWIGLFVLISDWAGIWQPVLTKDTLVWSATAGISVLVGFTEAAEPGYFRREFSKVLSVVVVFEYIMNFASFSFWIEFLLQPLLFFLIVAPTLSKEPRLQETWRRVRSWFLVIIGVAILYNTGRTLYASWQTVDWGLFVLRLAWPMLLGTWVLVLVFPLAVVASYEEAFVRLRMYRDKCKGLWKAKLGLVLALGIRLRWIREAAKGGTRCVANTESVGTAYEAAKRYKAERVLTKQQEEAN